MTCCLSELKIFDGCQSVAGNRLSHDRRFVDVYKFNVAICVGDGIYAIKSVDCIPFTDQKKLLQLPGRKALQSALMWIDMCSTIRRWHSGVATGRKLGGRLVETWTTPFGLNLKWKKSSVEVIFHQGGKCPVYSLFYTFHLITNTNCMLSGLYSIV